MVFWAHDKRRLTGEVWVTPEKHKAWHLRILENQKTKRDSDPLARLKGNTRSLMIHSLKTSGLKKNTKTESILGCSFKSYKKHIQSQFTEGMTWENQGEWHVDHRLPVSAGKTEDEIIKLNHHSNLQPMWKRENIIKGDSYCPKQLEEYLH